MNNTSSISRTNVNHDLNCWADHFDAIEAGLKTADVRRTDDRANIVVGDTITFLRTDPKTGEAALVDGKVRKVKVLVTHKNTAAGKLALFGVEISEWNRPGLIVPFVALSISVIE